MVELAEISPSAVWSFLEDAVKSGIAEWSVLGVFWAIVLEASRRNAKRKLIAEHQQAVLAQERELDALNSEKSEIVESIRTALHEKIDQLDQDIAGLKRQARTDRRAFVKMKQVATRLVTQMVKMRAWIKTLETAMVTNAVSVPQRDFDLDAVMTLDDIDAIDLAVELDGDREPDHHD